MSVDDFNNGLIMGLSLKGTIHKSSDTEVKWYLAGKDIDSRWKGLRIPYGYLAFNGAKWTTRNPFQKPNYSEYVLFMDKSAPMSLMATRPTLAYTVEVV